MFSVMSIKNNLAYFIPDQPTVICDTSAGGMVLIARAAD